MQLRDYAVLEHVSYTTFVITVSTYNRIFLKTMMQIYLLAPTVLASTYTSTSSKPVEDWKWSIGARDWYTNTATSGDIVTHSLPLQPHDNDCVQLDELFRRVKVTVISTSIALFMKTVCLLEGKSSHLQSAKYHNIINRSHTKLYFYPCLENFNLDKCEYFSILFLVIFMWWVFSSLLGAVGNKFNVQSCSHLFKLRDYFICASVIHLWEVFPNGFVISFENYINEAVH